jgi:hypothetical protein
MWIVCIALFIALSLYYLKCMQVTTQGLQAMSDNAHSRLIDQKRAIQLQPFASYQKTVVFYPGAFVDPRAYVPMGRYLAANNIGCIIVKMPLRCALFAYSSAKNIINHEDIRMEYILGGHSHGASMALKFVRTHPYLFHKIMLLGSRYPQMKDMSDMKLRVLKIYGTRDGIETARSVEANRKQLPSDAIFLKIEGGNHSGFAEFRHQPFDKKALISKAQQQLLSWKAMVDFIHQND